MKTKVIKNEDALFEAAELIKRGELVAVPTETVYGLACNGLCAEAVEQVYEVKGRPEVKPLSLMLHKGADISAYCRNVPPQAETLIDRFWPGPLTIVLESEPCVPDIVRAGGATVALRCPDHPMTQKMLELAAVPFAAPSANPSGEKSPVTAQDVLGYFDGRISAVVDGGRCGLGLESTIIDMSSAPFKILRQGAMPRGDIAAALAEKLSVIGITGGTGCGKTTALNCLEELGALIIDCDAVYHELLANSSEMLGDIEAAFPGTVTDGALDRKALGARVFSDDGKLKQLNTITHGYISRAVRQRLMDWALSGGTVAAIDAIALIESGLGKLCGAVVGVTADSDKRIARIMQRDGISYEYAAMRVSAQKPNEFFEQNCTYVLENNGSAEEFENECKNLFKEVLKNE